MANRKGLGKSKKFANGSIHENGTGRFMILNRYEGEDGQPWLEFEWLSGDKEGTLDSNKEMNMNASIHKFITNKKAAGEIPVEPVIVDTDHLTIMDKMDVLMGTVVDNRVHVSGLADAVLGAIDKALLFNKEQIDGALEVARIQRAQTAELIEKMNILTDIIRERDVTIEKLNATVSALVTHSTMVNKQQEMLNKMVDTITGGNK
jgi:hypothetical protein